MCMQIFRISSAHHQSAQFLDNRRLSKQVLELYQIIRVCLAEMNIIKGNTRYLSHPIVKHVYHDGEPYLLDAYALLRAMDEEHQQRGGKRSSDFREDLNHLECIITQYQSRFSAESLPPIFIYGDEKVYGEAAYIQYQRLLYEKWSTDRIPPRCNIYKTQI